MALVEYSDSEESETEHTKPVAPSKPVVKAPTQSNTNFSIDRSNPQKIRVKLAEAPETNGTHEDEPVAKRPRTGGGAFSGFNSLLPPPKRDTDSKPHSSIAKAPARKVFSLKTGAEPGFSRESDAELRSYFADQNTGPEDGFRNHGDDVEIPDIPKKTFMPQPSLKGNAFMFKPLSVARGSNTKRKKPINGIANPATSLQEPALPSSTAASEQARSLQPPKKVSLFSTDRDQELEALPIEPPEEDDKDPIPGNESDDIPVSQPPVSEPSHDNVPQDLDSIASDLNLSAAERRRLFGRGAKSSGSAINISNFNMDQEYIANEELRATGEQQQHNPLRAIAPGKHSLKQLVNAAQGQKEALEESFASGRRNKKEAGNKYGW